MTSRAILCKCLLLWWWRVTDCQNGVLVEIQWFLSLSLLLYSIFLTFISQEQSISVCHLATCNSLSDDHWNLELIILSAISIGTDKHNKRKHSHLQDLTLVYVTNRKCLQPLLRGTDINTRPWWGPHPPPSPLTMAQSSLDSPTFRSLAKHRALSNSFYSGHIYCHCS